MRNQIQAALKILESKRSACSSYAQFQALADEVVLKLAESVGEIHLSSFTDTPLWLAAHRLERRGVFAPRGVENFWGLAARPLAA